MQRREECFKNLIFVFFIIFFLWILLQFLAPIAIPHGAASDISGLVFLSDNENLITEINQPWSFVYSAGDRLCHQISDRSFFINGNQMPFCSRCTAIWLGLAIGLGFMVFYKVELNEKFIFFLIFSIIPIGIDGFGQLFGFWQSTNIIRVLTGLLIGLVCGVGLGVIIDEIKNMNFFQKKNNFNKKNS